MPQHIGRPVPLVCFASRDEFLGIAPTILEPTTGLPARSYVDTEINEFGEFFSQNLTVIKDGKTQGNAVVTLKEGDIWHKLKKGEPLAWDTIYHVLGGKPEKQNDDWNMLSLSVATLFTTGILVSRDEPQKVVFEVNSLSDDLGGEGEKNNSAGDDEETEVEELGIKIKTRHDLMSWADKLRSEINEWKQGRTSRIETHNEGVSDPSQKIVDKPIDFMETEIGLLIKTRINDLLTKNNLTRIFNSLEELRELFTPNFADELKGESSLSDDQETVKALVSDLWQLLTDFDKNLKEIIRIPPKFEAAKTKQFCKDLHIKYVIPLWNFLRKEEIVPKSSSSFWLFRQQGDDTTDQLFTEEDTEPDYYFQVVGAPTNASMQQSSTATDFGDGHTAHSHSINRVYVPRDSLMDIYFAACAHKTSGIFENGPTYERPSGDTDKMARAEALIRVTSGVAESDAHTIYRGLCPTPQAAERFLCAFNEWYSGGSKAAKAFKNDPVVRMVLPESYFNLEEPPPSHNLKSAEMYECGIDFQPLYTIFKFPLRGDLCIFRKGHTSPTLPKEYPGHTIFSYARFQDFDKLRAAHELRVKATHYPALLGMANELHLGNPALDSLQGMTKPITEPQRELIEDTLDRISKSIHDIRNIVSFKEASLLSFVEAQETINALEHKLKHDLNLDVSPQVRRAVHRGRIENLKQQASHFSKNYAIDLIDQIETSLSPNLPPTLLNFMDDCKKKDRPIETLLTDLDFREYLLRNNLKLNTVADIIRR